MPESEVTFFNGEWTAPDGIIWLSQRLVNPAYKRDWKRKHPGQSWPYPAYEPPHEISHPRLMKLRVEAADYAAPAQPGRIRGLRVSIRTAQGHVLPTWVYHPVDLAVHSQAPDMVHAFKDADRQQDEEGRWILSRRAVAKLFGVDGVTVWSWQKNGIPWMDRRKPKKVRARHGHYGNWQDYWLESEAKEFKEAWDKLPGDKLPDGLVAVQDAAKGRSLTTLAKMGREEGVVCRVQRTESRRGKRRTVTYTTKRSLIHGEDYTEYVQSRTQAPLPPSDTLTVRQVAGLLGVSPSLVLRLFPKEARRQGKLLIDVRRKDSRPHTQLHEGAFYIPVAKVRRVWEKRKPGVPWPLFIGNPISSSQIAVPVGLAEQPAKPTKRRRGRPAGSIDKKAADRNKKMRDAWKAKEYGSIAELARAFHVSRTHASDIVNG